MIAVTTDIRRARRQPARPTPARRPSEQQARETERLLEYLATHDAECPDCGYNMRGNTEGACPECGRSVRLGLRAGDALSRRHGLLLLLFTWLLMAGLMNAVRTGREIDTVASRETAS